MDGSLSGSNNEIFISTQLENTFFYHISSVENHINQKIFGPICAVIRFEIIKKYLLPSAFRRRNNSILT